MKVLHDSTVPALNLAPALFRDFLLKSLVKVTTLLEYVRKSYVQCVYIKKQKRNFFNSLIFFITFHAI